MLHLVVDFLVKQLEMLLKQGAYKNNRLKFLHLVMNYLIKALKQQLMPEVYLDNKLKLLLQQLHYLTQLQTYLNLKKAKLVSNPKNNLNNKVLHLKQVYMGLKLIKINQFKLYLNHNYNLPLKSNNLANQLVPVQLQLNQLKTNYLRIQNQENKLMNGMTNLAKNN